MRYALLAALTLIAALQCGAVDKTTRKGRLVVREPAVEEATAVTVVNDTIIPEPGLLVLAGYDKPLNARRESLFLTNNSARHLNSVMLELTYVDKAGRMLHRRCLWVATDVPPGETRRLDFASWDKTQTFYYVGGAKPRRDKASPYDVRVAVVMASTPSES